MSCHIENDLQHLSFFLKPTTWNNKMNQISNTCQHKPIPNFSTATCWESSTTKDFPLKAITFFLGTMSIAVPKTWVIQLNLLLWNEDFTSILRSLLANRRWSSCLSETDYLQKSERKVQNELTVFQKRSCSCSLSKFNTWRTSSCCAAITNAPTSTACTASSLSASNATPRPESGQYSRLMKEKKKSIDQIWPCK